MTREERREALEELLADSGKTVDIECGNSPDNNCTAKHCNADDPKKPACSVCPNTSLSSSDEEPVCSICLVEYEPSDAVFRSKSCSHMFHRECLFSWLERRNNTVSFEIEMFGNHFDDSLRNLLTKISASIICRNAPFVEHPWCRTMTYGMLSKE